MRRKDSCSLVILNFAWDSNEGGQKCQQGSWRYPCSASKIASFQLGMGSCHQQKPSPFVSPSPSKTEKPVSRKKTPQVPLTPTTRGKEGGRHLHIFDKLEPKLRPSLIKSFNQEVNWHQVSGWNHLQSMISRVLTS